ncbi:MAG: ROK family protein [Acidimicrobiales bacterium]
MWAAAVAEGDPVAGEVLAEAVAALGLGVANVWNLLDLERVVIGGGMAGKLGPYLAEGIVTAARPHVVRPIAADQVVAAVLGDDAGIVGASEAVRDPGRLPA